MTKKKSVNEKIKVVKGFDAGDAPIIFSMLKNIQDGYQSQHKIVQDSLKTTNENIIEMRKENKETFVEISKEQSLMRQEIRDMYKCIVDISSDNKIMREEMENKIERINDEIQIMKEKHCSDEKKEILDQLIKKYKGKQKKRRGIIKYFRDLSLNNLKGILGALLLIVWPVIVFNIGKIWKTIVEFFQNLNR